MAARSYHLWTKEEIFLLSQCKTQQDRIRLATYLERTLGAIESAQTKLGESSIVQAFYKIQILPNLVPLDERDIDSANRILLKEIFASNHKEFCTVLNEGKPDIYGCYFLLGSAGDYRSAMLRHLMKPAPASKTISAYLTDADKQERFSL